MAINLLHEDQLGHSTEFTTTGLEVKADNSGNVKFTVSEQGLKGDVTLPEAFDPSTLQAEIQALKAQNAELVSKNQAQDTEIQALKAREDLHVSGMTLNDETNELTLTVDGGATLTASLGKFVDVAKSAENYWGEIKALPDHKAVIIEILKSPEAKAALLEVLRGEEVKNFGGTTTRGYLLPTD
ncbi:hypothetical protein BMT54_01765 [Pasteurellaceae bacterium 15-036681]|nr:hypothetical protein BMT54_01765 [Pasteurellaceae bacterium 15-036681]